jgi:hypothetical protein
MQLPISIKMYFYNSLGNISCPFQAKIKELRLHFLFQWNIKDRSSFALDMAKKIIHQV